MRSFSAAISLRSDRGKPPQDTSIKAAAAAR
jgi:hypothetical protein